MNDKQKKTTKTPPPPPPKCGLVLIGVEKKNAKLKWSFHFQAHI